MLSGSRRGFRAQGVRTSAQNRGGNLRAEVYCFFLNRAKRLWFLDLERRQSAQAFGRGLISAAIEAGLDSFVGTSWVGGGSGRKCDVLMAGLSSELEVRCQKSESRDQNQESEFGSVWLLCSSVSDV